MWCRCTDVYCEHYRNCPQNRIIPVQEHSERDDAGMPLFFGVCESTNHTISDIPFSEIKKDIDPLQKTVKTIIATGLKRTGNQLSRQFICGNDVYTDLGDESEFADEIEDIVKERINVDANEERRHKELIAAIKGPHTVSAFVGEAKAQIEKQGVGNTVATTPRATGSKGFSKSAHVGSTFDGVSIGNDLQHITIHGYTLHFTGLETWEAIDRLVDAYFKSTPKKRVLADFSDTDWGRLTSKDGKKLRELIHRQTYEECGMPKQPGNTKYTGKAWIKRKDELNAR